MAHSQICKLWESLKGCCGRGEAGTYTEVQPRWFERFENLGDTAILLETRRESEQGMNGKQKKEDEIASPLSLSYPPNQRTTTTTHHTT